ncbi:MAG: YjgN family protein [Rhizobiaceae bacterium]
MDDAVAGASVSGARPEPRMTREQFTFTGTAREYFGIWIVNILLTIVTLGIYSAWAKVRRKRYFYGNTWIAGSSFEYHARPMTILIGRIIVLAIIIAYNLAVNFLPIVGAIIGVAFLFAVPWFVMRGLRFNARVTSYRNIRFDFVGGYWGAFLAFVLGGALAYATFGILAPIASQWMWSYMLGNLRYGDRTIACDPRLEKLYGQWLLPFVTVVVGSIAMAIIGVGIFFLLASVGMDLEGWMDAGDDAPVVLFLFAIYAAFIPFFLLFAVAGLLYRAGTRNVALNETIIDSRHLMASSIHRGRYAWIAVTNFLATIFTLGLARPWAAIRMAKYLAACTAIHATGSFDEYLGEIADSGAAVGSEFMDVEGLDFGF